jgi:hypothetical protein
MFQGSVKRGVVDGELNFLASGLRESGFEVRVYDGYRTKSDPSGLLISALEDSRGSNIILWHIWKVEFLESGLAALFRSLEDVNRGNAKIVMGAFGYLASSLRHRLNANGDWFDFVVGAEGIDWLIADRQSPDALDVAEATRQRLSGERSGTASDVSLSEDVTADSVVSIGASRGCRARCTFCAYNADLGHGWHPRPIATVAEEITLVLAQRKTRKIAFYDNDFGGSRDELTERARALHRELSSRGLLGAADIALNARSDCLTRETIEILSEIGVRTILTGLESFNPTTRLRLFGKRVDMAHLRTVIDACDQFGIELLLSYILWHPHQSLEGVGQEVKEIVAWGRHRIPQFLSRSQLSIVPGTPIARILGRQGLVTQASEFSLRPLYAHSGTGEWLGTAQAWLKTQFASLPRAGAPKRELYAALARLKQQELAMYVSALC